MLISFLGDISLTGYYIDLHNREVDPFKGIVPHIKLSDYIVGNLECTVKGEYGENERKKDVDG